MLLGRLWDKMRGGHVKAASLTAVLFRDAARLWLDSRRPYLGDKARTRYEFYLRPLCAFFAEQRLVSITPDMIRAYQRARSAEASPGVVNHECSLLQQMLKRIGRWPELVNDYQPLPLPKAQYGRALSDAEYTRLMRMGASNPNWAAAFLFASIALTTTMSTGEVLTLRLCDVDLTRETVRVSPEGAKNPDRQRSIPLNPYALEAARQAMERARQFGASDPLHYLFPFGSRGRIDPTKHQTTIKTAWREMTAAAEIDNFPPNNCRHHAISRLLESATVSEYTAEQMAGHVSVRMKKRYAHVRMETLRKAAVGALAPPWESGGKRA